MDYKTLSRQQMEFKIWDILNEKFLHEFQTDHGQWMWGQQKDVIGQHSWHWILDHPDDFVVCQYVGINDMNEQKIFTYDIVDCWSENTGIIRGFIEFVNGFFLLNAGNDLKHWMNAENIHIVGNIFEHSVLLG